MSQTPASAGILESIWLASTARTSYPALDRTVDVDVAIVGGGLTGFCAATMLKAASKRVAVLESQQIVQQVTAHTTGKLTSLHTLIYQKLIQNFGQETAAIYAAANQWGIQWIADTVAEQGIDCAFAPAKAYTYAADPAQLEKVEKEVEAAQSLELPATFVSETELPYSVLGAVCFDNQAQFHARKFVMALAAQIPGDGSHVFEHTQARAIDDRAIDDKGTMTVQTEGGAVRAQDVIIATHFPFYDPALYFARLAPYRTYLIAARLDTPSIQGMYIAADSFHTLRSYPVPGGETLISGGEGHKTGQGGDTVARYQRIEEWTRRHFAVRDIAHRWSSQGYITPDQIPYIGHATPTSHHLYVACGYNKWGLSHAPAAARILADLILEQDNLWVKVYDPNRFDTAGVPPAVKENVNVAKEYVKGFLSSGAEEPVAPGEGKIIETDNGKVAAYRDEKGTLYRLSPVCTHLGCVVEWNPAEQSWDCPCHGSRFAATGAVLQGPALEGLPPARRGEEGEISSL